MIMDIDFDNINHINYIKKLAKRNKFYERELDASIEQEYIPKKRDNIECKGLLYIDNKKVIGFITYQYVGKLYIKVDFMLIDKDFQNKGYGKQLINKLINIKPSFIVIECDEKTKEYYIKNFNFFEISKEDFKKDPEDECENKNMCVFHYLRHAFNKKFSYVYKI